MNEEIYGIDKEHAHKRAIELIPEDFFWDNSDESAPFGSDEGDTALAEFRDWRADNKHQPVYEFLKFTIESVGEIALADYNENMLDRELIKTRFLDLDFNDVQYVFTLDTSIIAAGFGQLVDEGKIDGQCKPLIRLAIDRLKIRSEFADDPEYTAKIHERMNVLMRALNAA